MNAIPFNSQICDHKLSLQNFAQRFTKNNDDADDLVQDTLLKAIRYANLYKDGTNLRAWLFTIMRNTYINSYRVNTTKRNIIQTKEDLSSLDFLLSASANHAENQFISEDIYKALKKLTPDYHIPFIRYVEGFRYYEIAEELNIPLGTVKTRIHVARQLLKRNLKMYKDFDTGKLF